MPERAQIPVFFGHSGASWMPEGEPQAMAKAAMPNLNALMVIRVM
jgi:hypothetical protein